MCSLNSATGQSRSCVVWPTPSVSRSCPAAGSSNAHLPGLIATAASPKTSRGQSPAPKLGSISPRSSFSLGEWRVLNSIYTILSRTLKLERLPAELDTQSYKDHLTENAEHRLTVDLPMYSRETALMAFVSAVEIASLKLREFTKAKFTEVKRIKDSLKILELFNDRFSLEGERLLVDYGHLVIIRNFSVHNRRDQKRDLDFSVKSLAPNFYINTTPWIGEYVFIERGGLEPYIANMNDFILKLYEQA